MTERKPRTPQQATVRAILRELAPVRGERRMEDGEDLVLLVSLKRPLVLQSYRVAPDGEITDRRSYTVRRNDGVLVKSAGYRWDEVRTPAYVGARLPLFANVAEAVRFLADFPMIPTEHDALAHVRDEATGRMGDLGTITERRVISRFTRTGERVAS